MDECVSVTKSELTTASSVYLGSDPVLKGDQNCHVLPLNSVADLAEPRIMNSRFATLF